MLESCENLAGQNVELAMALDEAEGKLKQLTEDYAELKAQADRDRARNAVLEAHIVELTQRLEEAESTNTRLERELDRKGADFRQAELELRTAISKLAELKGELRLKAGNTEALQQQVVELKEQVARELTQAVQPAQAPDKLASLYQGVPGEVFSNVLQEVLGAPGRSLVEQIYQRCHVDFRSTHVADLALVAEKLQQLALKVARTPSQAERIRLGLNRCRTFLEIPADAVPLRAASPGRSPSRPRPELLNFGSVDSELSRKIEAGMKLVTLERYEQAQKLFEELLPHYPECVEVYAGLFYAYAGFGCYAQAYEVGRRIQPTLTGETRERFRKAYTRVVSELVDMSRDVRQAKRWLLELAELHEAEPRRALGFLRRASRIPERIEEEATLDRMLREMMPQVDSGSVMQAVG